MPMPSSGVAENSNARTSKKCIQPPARPIRRGAEVVSRVHTGIGEVSQYAAMTPAPIKPEIPFDPFAAVDVRVGTIVSVHDVAGSSTAARFRLHFGDPGPR